MKFAESGALLCVGAALLVPQSAQAQAARWSIDASGARCTLSRPVGGKTPTTLVIRSVPTTEEYEVMLVRESWPEEITSRSADFELTFQPGATAHKRPLALTDLGEEIGSALGADYFEQPFIEDFGRSKGMRIVIGKKDIGSFSYSGADKAAVAFDLCMVAKLIEWGADTAGLQPGAQRPEPRGNPNEWMFRDGFGEHFGSHSGIRAGIAKLQLDVEGRIEGCEVLEAEEGSLGSSACRRLKEAARYKPARDKNGQPVRTVTLVSWDLRFMETIGGRRPRD